MWGAAVCCTPLALSPKRGRCPLTGSDPDTAKNCAVATVLAKRLKSHGDMWISEPGDWDACELNFHPISPRG